MALQAQVMRYEIALLKGQKAKPSFKSSKMEESADKEADKADGEPADADGTTKRKRAGSHKRSKTA